MDIMPPYRFVRNNALAFDVDSSALALLSFWNCDGENAVAVLGIDMLCVNAMRERH
jgi:hypothetical protein